jgi:hypothetical protein
VTGACCTPTTSTSPRLCPYCEIGNQSGPRDLPGLEAAESNSKGPRLCCQWPRDERPNLSKPEPAADRSSSCCCIGNHSTLPSLLYRTEVHLPTQAGTNAGHKNSGYKHCYARVVVGGCACRGAQTVLLPTTPQLSPETRGRGGGRGGLSGDKNSGYKRHPHGVLWSRQLLTSPTTLVFFFSVDLGKLAKPSYQMVLERALGIRNQSSPMLQLSHSSVW